MTQDNLLNTPWTLAFDRDGTEDFGIICDAEGGEIVASHLPCTRLADRTFQSGTFWLPEEEGEETPTVVRQLFVMTAAPKLLRACKLALAALEDAMEAEDPQARTQVGWEGEPMRTLRIAIAEAEGHQCDTEGNVIPESLIPY